MQLLILNILVHKKANSNIYRQTNYTLEKYAIMHTRT